MTLMNIHFTIRDLTPRYPVLANGANLISVRDQIAAAALASVVSHEEYLIAIGPRRAARINRVRTQNRQRASAAASLDLL